MLATIKLIAGAVFALCILSPSFVPRSDTCECKAKASAHQSFVPQSDTCTCKAKAMAPSVPHADTCECKAKKTP